MRGAAAPSEAEVSTAPFWRMRYMPPTAYSTSFHRESGAVMRMSTESPGARERMTSWSHSPLALAMDRMSFPWGMGWPRWPQ